MKNKLHRMILLVLAFVFVLQISITGAKADNDAPPVPVYFDLPSKVNTIKVGLCFGSGALGEAQFVSDSGFSFGYYDNARTFHALGTTTTTRLSVQGDIGFELDDGMYLGPWHMILNNVYSSYEEAFAASGTLWGGFPGYINGEYRVMVGAYADEAATNKEISRRKLDATAFTGSGNSVLISETGTPELRLMYDDESGRNFAICPNSANTSFKENMYPGGFEFYRNGQKVSVINYVGLEDYVRGVLPYEMHGDWPVEALKAQASCARTYAINNLNSYSEMGFDVRNDTYSQMYCGITGTTSGTDNASDLTDGQFVRYRGAVCKVYYMSSDGGATESSANVFGEKRAYLSGTKDPYENDVEFYNKSWTFELWPENVAYRLNRYDYNLGEVTEIETVNSALGNVIELKVSDSDGKTVIINGEDCFREMSLNSVRYSVEKQTNDKDETLFVFKGNGWGHNCGMSQWGAYSMAHNHNADCAAIINFYFSGAYLG